jgi:hypothetical protein
MRQPRTPSIAQTYVYTPDNDMLQDPWTPLTTRRVSRYVSFVLGLALGTGVAPGVLRLDRASDSRRRIQAADT